MQDGRLLRHEHMFASGEDVKLRAGHAERRAHRAREPAGLVGSAAGRPTVGGPPPRGASPACRSARGSPPLARPGARRRRSAGVRRRRARARSASARGRRPRTHRGAGRATGARERPGSRDPGARRRSRTGRSPSPASLHGSAAARRSYDAIRAMSGTTQFPSLAWLRQRDRGFAALRRAGRTAMIMPAMFALGDKVIGNPAVATFAAFGSFAMLLLVDFSGPMRDRLQAQAALARRVRRVRSAVGTLASQYDLARGRRRWRSSASACCSPAVVSSVLAGATTSLLLAFILPVSLPGPASPIPDRLAGWGMAAAAVAARDRAAVAGAGARPAARARRSRPAGRSPRGCARRSRSLARRRGPRRCRRARARRSRPRRRGVALCTGRSCDAVPPDRPDHRAPRRGPAGRRAELAERDRPARAGAAHPHVHDAQSPRLRGQAVGRGGARARRRSADMPRAELAAGRGAQRALRERADAARAQRDARAARRRRARAPRSTRGAGQRGHPSLDPSFRAQELSFVVIADRAQHRR